jgi:hypothetical protein
MKATKRFSKGALAAAVAAAVLGLAAMSAQANLQWRVTDTGTGQTILVCDNNIGVGCLALGDLNPAPEVITVDTTLINGILTGKFDFTAAGADDNILTATTLAVINSSFQVQVTGGGADAADLLIVEATRDGWLIPLGVPRTLTNGPSATLTQTAGSVASTGFNDGNNILFGTQFATPTSTFIAGVAPCNPIVGEVSTCADLQQLGGIVEPNPYSLTNRQDVSSPAGDSPATYLVTDASTKFGSQQAPEPTSLLLLGAGLAALGFGRRRKTA